MVEVSAAKINAIAELPGVLAVEVEPVSRLQNDVARGLILADPIADNLV